MTLEDQPRTYDGPVSWPDRLKRARYVLAAKEHLARADVASGIADFGPLP